VLCFADTIAFGVTQAAADLGRRDLAVVGFDDHPLAAQIRPALTTVRQDVEAKGRAAAALLTRAIDTRAIDHAAGAEHVMLPTELIVRESTQNPLPPREVPA
jgi:DNA-binding LacI/PurR family transcriptional regulator